MTNIFFMIPVFLFLVGFWIYVSKRKHLMNMLISLEYIVLSIFLLVVLVSFTLGLETYVSLMFLIASVCEGSLGVGIMVGMVRSHGSDYVSSFSVLKC
uniref:NADH-ubiquinone oxidoreductase chain 4L n=1 Tax=Notochthamalus scabrosus TaxID=261896 RepID=U5LTP5_NOTSA|nr:NADH dehydrogenase subunit 4L [Notochthamalus scabrosus]AGX31544.1 NADH dehydrogenase subunit 4L [Notochthamalus scabrosus]AGX31557.1 NADH dehydrogenase subunit 4L [Notochthamalus scabrosus]AGX31583.1 NADH dehydrogenase subunit 4L [Notochthamalus scabrosus]AGX31596.1 NADH dehydrogenase subunit 4L [Notochthamalus scabrosus]AGX31609.1 NADH dehydrogenase subunit 4L [Notochthamalus scabrosus]